MPRTLTVLFRRDPRRDCRHGTVFYEGYQILWPDGRPVTVGIESFCQRGQRLLGLGRQLAGLPESLIELRCYPLRGVEEPLTRLPGTRVRRLFLERFGGRGRLHFLDGTPTALVFDLARDEFCVLDWIGLPTLGDGQRQWLDLAARPIEFPHSHPSDLMPAGPDAVWAPLASAPTAAVAAAAPVESPAPTGTAGG
jgi:hypothetical protein